MVLRLLPIQEPTIMPGMGITPRQAAMPFADTMCCAAAAGLLGWEWGRMARAIRRQNAAPPGSSMRGVRVSPDQVRAISRG